MKMRFEHLNLLWLLLVLPPALALFFWWSERLRQKLLTQFIEARLLLITDGWNFANSTKIALCIFDFGGGAFDFCPGAATTRI